MMLLAGATAPQVLATTPTFAPPRSNAVVATIPVGSGKDDLMAVKRTIHLSDEAVQALEALADKNGITVTEQLGRAISAAQWIGEQKKVLVEDDQGRLQQVVFRP